MWDGFLCAFSCYKCFVISNTIFKAKKVMFLTKGEKKLQGIMCTVGLVYEIWYLKV